MTQTSLLIETSFADAIVIVMGARELVNRLARDRDKIWPAG